MATTETLQFILEAQDKTKDAFNSVQGGLDRVKGNLEDMKPQFQKMAAIGTASFLAIGGAIYSAVDAFAESQKQLAVADQALTKLSKDTLKGMGGSVDDAKIAIREFGTELQSLGGISDEEASIGVAKLTQITGNYAEAQKAAILAADLAKYKNIDYASAVGVVGKVLNGNIGILSKFGIEVDKNTTKEQALALMTETFGGQYAAFGETIAGQTEIMKQSFGDIMENIGAAFIPLLQQLFDKIKPVIDKLVEWTAKHPELVKQIAIAGLIITALVAGLGFLGLVLPAVIAGVSALGTVFALLFSPVTLVILLIAALVAAGYYLYENWDILKENLAFIWDQIKLKVQSVWEEIKQFFIEYWPVLLAIFLGPLGILIAAIIKNWGTIKSTTLTVWGGIKDFFKGFWDGLKDIFAQAIDWIMDKINKLIAAWDKVKGVASSVGNAVGGAASYVGDKVGSLFRASGGSMNPNQPYIVGEHGPEMFTPNSYGRMTPGLAGGGLNITITGNSFLGKEGIAEMIGDQIVDVLKNTVKL